LRLPERSLLDRDAPHHEEAKADEGDQGRNVFRSGRRAAARRWASIFRLLAPRSAVFIERHVGDHIIL